MKKIRVYICMLGMDQHENGAIAVSRTLRDNGFEVIYGGTFNTPDTITRACEDEDIDIVGVSAHSWEYLKYIPDIISRLRDAGLRAKVVLGGSIITAKDATKLKEMGVAEVFMAGMSDQQIASAIRSIVA